MGRLVFVLVVLAIAWTIADSFQYTQTVQTTYGPVRGEEIHSDGTHYKSFTGIPYAAPPVKELRFKDPQPPGKWDSVRDAIKYGRICHQPSQADRLRLDVMSKIRLFFTNAPNMAKLMMRFLQQSEDCLSLNVYTKELGESGLKPVIVWIHGGGFMLGDGTDTMYGPEFLVDQDVVLVTINYRLGPLGFLSTNTSDASGNWGLKDQVAALRWVQENIKNFGGDPKQVTIYGESAGGSSVHYLLLTPLAKGLFSKAIASSGSATCNWANTDQQERYSRNLARALGASDSESNDPARRIQFLRTVSPKKMTEHMWDVLDEEDLSAVTTPIPFAPVVEPAGTEGAFITENPKKMVVEGKYTKVPLMMGFNDLEGSLIYMGFSRYNTPESMKKLDQDPCFILPRKLRDAVNASNDCPTVSQKLRDLYFDGKPIGSSEQNYVYMIGDVGMTHGIYFAQRQHAHLATAENPIYNYYFTYDGEWNVLKRLFDIKIPGAAHGDDIPYIFKNRLMKVPSLEPGSPGEKTQKRLISFIINFAKSGNPVPATSDLVPIRWEPATNSESNFMRIGNELAMDKEVIKARMDFWDQLYKKYLS